MSKLFTFSIVLVVILVAYSAICNLTPPIPTSIEVTSQFESKTLSKVYDSWFDAVWAGGDIPSSLLQFVEENKSLTKYIPHSTQIKNERVIAFVIRETITDVKKQATNIEIEYKVDSYVWPANYRGMVSFAKTSKGVALQWKAEWQASSFSVFSTKPFANGLKGLFEDMVANMHTL